MHRGTTPHSTFATKQRVQTLLQSPAHIAATASAALAIGAVGVIATAPAKADWHNSYSFGNGNSSHSGNIGGNSYYGNTFSYGGGNSNTTIYSNGASATCNTYSYGSGSSTYCY